MSLTRWSGILAVFALFAAAGCAKDDHTSVGTGTVEVRVTDAPGAIEAIHLVVREVAVKTDTLDSGPFEVIRTDSDSVAVDLLTLQNGTTTSIGLATVPAGHYSEVRLKLGAGSTVTVDGVTYPLFVPSGTTSGVKVKGDFDVPTGGAVVLLLDFDAAKSVHQTGSGTWIMNPVIRLLTQIRAGAIQGVVQPTTVQTTVFAISGTDTTQTTLAASDGAFVLSVLGGGTYNVAFHPASAFRDTTLTNVLVTAGHTTDVGTMQLTAQ